jgi:hypothetical protein
MQAELKRYARALLLHSRRYSEYEPASEKLTPPRTHRRTDRCSAATNGSMRRAQRTDSTMTMMPQSTKSLSSRRAPIVPSPNRAAIAQLPANAAPNTSAPMRTDDGQHVFQRMRRGRCVVVVFKAPHFPRNWACPGKKVA